MLVQVPHDDGVLTAVGGYNNIKLVNEEVKTALCCHWGRYRGQNNKAV